MEKEKTIILQGLHSGISAAQALLPYKTYLCLYMFVTEIHNGIAIYCPEYPIIVIA